MKEYKFFVDEQRFGPYKLWHHQHFFEEKEDYVLMKDVVTYAPPFGLLGWIANKLFIPCENKQNTNAKITPGIIDLMY